MPARPLSAHIGYLFTELPFGERIAAAKRAGFDAVEHPNPQLLPAAGLKRLLDDEGVSFAQMAVVGADPEGAKGIAAIPGREAEFRERFRQALDFAEEIGSPLLHPMAGASDHPDARRVYRDNLAFAVAACHGRPVTVLVEALSRRVVPGYVVSTLAEALDLTAGHGDAAKLLVDTFHAAENGEDAAAIVAAHPQRIGHIHIADHPGRHEPGSGRLDFQPLLNALIATGYRGAIGFEYAPAAATEAGLDWVPGWKRALQRTMEVS